MNLIIKRYKILIISFSMFFLIFNCFKPQKANAVALVDDLVVGGGITVSTGAIVALAGTTLVAGGVYLDSTLNDSNVSRYVVSKMIDTGNALNYWGSKTLESGKQVLTWTSEGLKEFYDVLSSTIESGVPYENVSGVSGDTIDFVKPGTYTIVYTYDITFGDYGLQTETKVMSNTGGISIFSTSNSINVKDYLSNRVYIGLSGGITNLVVSSVLLDGNSVCVDVSESYRNFNDSICSDRVSSTSTSPDNSISYQPSIGVPLNPPLDGGSVGALNPSIDFPYGKTWDDLYPDVSIPKDTDTDIPDVDVPSDTTGDITGEGGSWVLNIPILGDILKVLLKILELLKTFVKTLIDALVSAITTLFVPSDTYFTDKFDGYRTTLIGKLGDNNFDFLQQSGSNIEDIYINIFGQQVCIVRITLFNKFKDFAFIVIRAFFYFFLILFNFNQVIKFLRGSIFSDYNSRESMAILQNNDNLDKIINNV